MAVRIGKTELKGIQNIHTEEARTLVEQRVPDQQGGVFQDLGREPVTIVADGFLFGDDTQSVLETLRAAQTKGDPQSFAADIATGTELTEVIIESFRVRQVAGYRNRYRFSLRLREHMEPPKPAGASIAPVNQSVKADAATWGEGKLGAAAVLQDPATLTGALEANPGLLAHISADDLANSVAKNMGSLNAAQIDGIGGKLAALNPAKAASFFDKLKDVGAMAGTISKYVKEGIKVAQTIAKLVGAAGGMASIIDFLQKLKAAGDSAVKLGTTVADLDLPPPVARLIAKDKP